MTGWNDFAEKLGQAYKAISYHQFVTVGRFYKKDGTESFKIENSKLNTWSSNEIDHSKSS